MAVSYHKISPSHTFARNKQWSVMDLQYNSTMNVSISMPASVYFNIDVRLEENINGSWKNIASRRTTVSTAHHGNGGGAGVTFTNLRARGYNRKMRLRVRLYDGNTGYTKLGQTVIHNFTR